MIPLLRLAGAAAAIGLWLSLFFLGRTAGGSIHVLPVLALALILWRDRGPRGPRGARNSQVSEGSS